MTDVSATQSVLEALKQLLAKDEKLDLYREWQNVLSNLDISPEVRNHSDDWFTRCHQFCEERVKRSESGITQDNTTEEELFQEFLQHVHEQMNNTLDPIEKSNLKDQLSRLQSFTPAEWIEKAYRCVVEEINLVEKYSKLKAAGACIETRKPFELLYLKLQEKKRVLGQMIERLEIEGQNLKQAKQSQEILHHAQQFQHAIDVQGTPRNGTESCIQQARKFVQDAEDNLKQSSCSFQTTVMNLKENLGEIYEEAKKLAENLLYEVKQWQHEFQLTYAELAGNMDLDRFAPCCARTGELLRDLLRTDMIRLENVINDVTGVGKSECDTLMRKFDDLLAWFYQSTFLVTKQDGSPKQDPWNIKKSLARTPKVTLRILGADTLDALGGVEVHACFLLESSVNKHYNCDEGVPDFDALEAESWRIKNSKLTKFVQQRSNHSVQQRIHEVTFSIELDVKLNRSKNTNVYKEKYRLIFWTQLDRKTYWAMSLPMVVTTGGNQNCQCLASVMWQCFSTDVFAIPTETLSTMSWSKVASMLQAKIQSLPSNRILTEENINHLKERLLGSAEVTDDTQVSLEQFCSVPLPQEAPVNETEEKKEEFTFWMWYLSIYNLIKTYLSDFWKNGWIEGFLSKEMASRKLKESKTYKPGTLLLRFSDQQIDKSQGKDTVFGKLATSLLIKNNGRCPEVRHVATIGHEQLAGTHLADILLQTENKYREKVYRYLYSKPDTDCEILFQGCQRKAQVVPVVGDGYVGVRNIFQADLEQLDDDLRKLGLEGKRRLSTGRNSEDRNKNHEESQEDTDEMTNFEVKRLKSDKSNTLPMVIDKSPIVVDKGHPIEVETDIVIGKNNMIGRKTNMAIGTNMAQDRTRMIGHETNLMSENAIQTARVPGYHRPNSSVLRKLLTEQPRDTVNNASVVITQNKNNNFMNIENSEQLKSDSIRLTESGITENKGNDLATQNIHNRLLINNNCPTVQMSENAEMSRTLVGTIQNQGGNQIISPYVGDTVNEIQPSRATIDGGHYDSLSLLDHEKFMELCDYQSIEPNGLCEANQIATSALDENQLVADPNLGQRSNENHSSDRLLDSLSGENLLSGGKGTFSSGSGGIQTQATIHQAIAPTTNLYALSDEKLMESIQKCLKALPPDKVVDTLKPCLESLAPHLLLKITPVMKIILEIITPSLKTLTPDLNQMVIQALQNSIEESQSHERPNQIDFNEEDSAATGLGLTELTQAELDDVLSVIESDSLPNVETIYDFESQE